MVEALYEKLFRFSSRIVSICDILCQLLCSKHDCLNLIMIGWFSFFLLMYILRLYLSNGLLYTCYSKQVKYYLYLYDYMMILFWQIYLITDRNLLVNKTFVSSLYRENFVFLLRKCKREPVRYIKICFSWDNMIATGYLHWRK